MLLPQHARSLQDALSLDPAVSREEALRHQVRGIPSSIGPRLVPLHVHSVPTSLPTTVASHLSSHAPSTLALVAPYATFHTYHA